MEPLSRLMQQPLGRREVLNAAAGLGLSFLLPGIGLRAAGRRGRERPKSLILLWMAGGPSQLETWDPHPEHKNGGPTQAIATRRPGLQIAEHFPLMAEHMDSLSVIRSLVSKEGDHQRATYYLKTGYRPDPTLTHPSVGAIVTHEIPAPHVEIPRHVSLGRSPFPSRGGFLGAQYDAFRIYEPGRNLHNMQARVGPARQTRRLNNLEAVSQAFRRGRAAMVDRSLHQETVRRALAMMTSEQLKAFDLTDEPSALKADYGDTRFGRGCLVARRLVEQGVRAVEVSLPGFDTHVNNFEGHREQAAILDPAFSRLIQDLQERDLFASTVVLCIGEFGRTNRINGGDGRDHWPTGFSCVLGGGGLQSGVVIGETDPSQEPKNNEKPKGPRDPVHVADLYATLFQVLGVDYGKQYIVPKIERPITISEGTPVERLL